MSQYGYGGRANPFDQRGGGGGAPQQQYNQGGYGGPTSPQYGGPAMGRDDDYGGQNVEMASLTQNGSQFGQQSRNPNAILNECREIDQGIQEIDKALKQLQNLQLQSLNDVNNQEQMKKRVEGMSTEIMAMYRNLTGKVKLVKSQPESGSPKNAPQIGKVDRALKDMIRAYQRADADYTRRIQDQMARQYRIVRPEASEEEVQAAVQDTQSQSVFSQALLNSDRQGQSRSVLNAVQSRHEEIQKIEKQMIELAELFQDMDVLVVQQEAAVANIEMKGEEVVVNLDKGNEQVAVAIESARNTRKWKWWCLGICVLIVIIIVVVIIIYKFVIQTPATTTTKAAKRFILSDSIPMAKLTGAHAVIPGQDYTPKKRSLFPTDGHAMVPGLEWTGDNKLKMRTFRA